MPTEKKLFLLDAMALIYRAYFSLARSPRITTKGRNTNAQFGFTNTLMDLLNKEKPTHLAVVFEGGKSDADTNRTQQYAAYKANRQEQPEDISSALPDIQRIVEGFSLPCISSDGFEADDVIGTLALEAAELGYTVYMVTPDKDYGQLVRENVFIYKPGYMGAPHEILGAPEVCAKWSIKRVDQVIDILGLMGDAVDNIPGIAGVGEKTAAKLLAEYDTVEGVIAAADSIKGALGEKIRNGIDMAVLSKKLATIITDVPVAFHAENYRVKEWNKEALAKVFSELEFRHMSKRILGEELSITGPGSNVIPDLFTSAAANLPLLTEPPVEESTLASIETTPHEYHLVQSNEDITKLLNQLSEQKEISFDTETTGKDANCAELVGLSFSWKKGEGYYVPLPADRDAVIQILQLFQLQWEREDVLWIGQNIKYDMLMLKWYGFELRGKFFDTMLAHYVIEPEGKRGMNDLAHQYLRYSPVEITSLIGKKGKDQITMREVDVEVAKEYAAEDADVTLQLKEYFEPLLVSEKMDSLTTNIEHPLLQVLVDMEYEGVGLDVPFLHNYSITLGSEISEAEARIYELAGTRFNLGSPKQLGDVLFDLLKIDGGGRKTKTGQYATGEDVLAKLRKAHPVIDDILQHRQLTKLKSTYVDSLPLLINERTGRVHTCFNQTIAVTGRLSSNNPNLQNIPIRTERGREIRKAFIPRSTDHTLISVDYSQIELRIIAGLSGDEGMIEAFSSGLDIHTATAAKVYGISVSDVDGTMRRNAKAVNFGIIYGQSAFGLSEKLAVPRSEAKEIIENYFKQYPGIKKYIDTQIQTAREQQFVTTILGRRRWLRDIISGNQTVRGFAERNAVNMPIQGTAADMIKLAMIAVHRALKAQKLQTKMILQVHDELVFDVPHEEVAIASKLIKESMENAMVLPNGVPIVAETGVGANWLEAH